MDILGLHHIPTNSADIDIFLGGINFVGTGLGVNNLIQLVRIINDIEAIPIAALTTSKVNNKAKRAFTKAGFLVDSHYSVEPYGECISMTQELS